MLYRKDNNGDFVWDPLLWLLAPGVVVFLVGLAFLLKHFTPVAAP
jgi:hypothetical protein